MSQTAPMEFHERVGIYEQQAGNITPKQARRLRHKAHHQAAVKQRMRLALKDSSVHKPTKPQKGAHAQSIIDGWNRAGRMLKFSMAARNAKPLPSDEPKERFTGTLSPKLRQSTVNSARASQRRAIGNRRRGER